MKARLHRLTTPVSRVFRRLTRPVATITPLSTFLLMSCGYLLLGPVWGGSDIISASLALGILSVFALAQGVVILSGTWLRRTIRISVTAPGEEVHAGIPARIVVTLGALRVIPGTTLFVHIECDHPLPMKAQARIRGASYTERRVPLDITFPHRARWGVQRIVCELRDYAGLAVFRWDIPGRDTITVTPPPVKQVSLPILSSTQRPGDAVVDTTHKQGDPYDTKKYHPSDGMRKILWKVFAKRGELLSRHPEASMTPEGYVVIFLLARTTDDATAARAAAYVDELSELRLDVIVACEGIRGREPATDPSTTRELFIDSAWDAGHSSIESLTHDATELLDYCSAHGLKLSVKRIVLFCSGERVAEPEEVEKLTAFGEWLAHRGIEPVFCIDDPPLNRSTPGLVSAVSPRSPHGRRDRSRAERLFLVKDESAVASHGSPETYRSFLTGCLSRQWEVHV